MWPELTQAASVSSAWATKQFLYSFHMIAPYYHTKFTVMLYINTAFWEISAQNSQHNFTEWQWQTHQWIAQHSRKVRLSLCYIQHCAAKTYGEVKV
jgi:hypothetical protein